MRLSMPETLRGILITSLLAASAVHAQSFELLAGDPAAAHHYPGPDGRVGTGDDVVSAAPTGIIGSDPNVHGTYSFAAYESFGPGDPALPGDNTTVSFFRGSAAVDSAAASGGGGALLTGASATGTGFGQGLGVSTLEVLNVDGGSYDPGTGALTLQADIELSVAGLTQTFDDVSVSGTALVVDSADFGAGTGNAYVDNVLIPRAQSLNAGGLLFMEFTGQLPISPPMVIINAPFTVVLAGVTEVPAMNQADLVVSKSAPAGPFQAGDQFTFTLGVENQGPGDAAGVTVQDPFPDELDWVADSCGAGPPSSGVLAWTVGALADGGALSCDVTVDVNGAANFDFENGAVVFGDTLDPQLTDNVAATPVASDQPAASEGLAQAPDQGTGFPSDADCGSCPTGEQIIAENFKIESQAQLNEIVFHGGYTDNQPFADQFTVLLYDDRRVSPAPGIQGVPGDPVADLGGAVAREPTGNVIGGFFDEYRYSVNASLDLSRGTYWLLVYNDSGASGSQGDWFWETGGTDAAGRSLRTVAANVAVPPQARWSPNPDVQMALTLEAGLAAAAPQAIPIFRPAGMLLLVLAALLLARAYGSSSTVNRDRSGQ